MSKQKMLKFTIAGKVGRMVDPGSDPDYFSGAHLKEEFEAPTLKRAVEIAQEKVKLFLEKNAEHAPTLSDQPEGSLIPPKTYDFTLLQHVWEQMFIPSQRAQRGISFPAKPARKARVEEHVLV
jgi:hypothetical protein